MRILNLVILYLLFLSQISAQNLISNPGFETGNSFPNNYAQAHLLDHWESDQYNAGGGIYVHSPDWFYSFGPAISAHSGGGMLGMGNYELIEQNINLSQNQFYLINLNFLLYNFPLAPWSGSTLRIFIAKNKVEYKSNDLCGNNYNEYQNGLFQDIIQVASLNLDLAVYGFSTWNQFNCSFKTPHNGNYNYICFDVIKTVYSGGGGSTCQDAYIMLDDISVVPLCSNFCSVGLPPITHTTFQNQMIANNLYQTFRALIENAMYVNFTIWDGNGGLIYEYESYDPNGLHDEINGIVYPDLMIEWNGVDMNGNTITMMDGFVYVIKMWSCTSGWIDTGLRSLVYHPPISPPGFPNIPEYYNCELDYCCPQNASIQNQIYNQVNARTDVINHIDIATTGSVSIFAGSTVKFHAGNSITAGSNIYIQAGAEIEMRIVPCGTQRIINVAQQMNNIRHDHNYDENSGYVKHCDDDFELSPNPNTGIFKIRLNKSCPKEMSLEIYSLIGLKIHESNIEAGMGIIGVNLEYQTPGTYVCILKSIDKIITKKLLIF